MKMSLDEFLAKNKPAGKSKLDKFIHEIFELKNKGYTLDQMLSFLSMNDVGVSKSTLHHFIKTRSSTYKNNEQKRSNEIEKNKIQSNKPEVISNKTESPKPNSDWTPPPWAPKDLNLDDYI